MGRWGGGVHIIPVIDVHRSKVVTGNVFRSDIRIYVVFLFLLWRPSFKAKYYGLDNVFGPKAEGSRPGYVYLCASQCGNRPWK